MSQNLQNSHFVPFFCNKKQQYKFYFLIFLGNIVVHIHAKYRNDRMKTEGAYSIWKTVDGRRTVFYRINSADYGRSWAKKV